MKRFRFPLEKLLGWRRTEYERQEAALQALFRLRSQQEEQSRALADSAVSAFEDVVTSRDIAPAHLLALGRYRDFAVREQARLQEQIKATDTKIEDQRLKTVEALRGVEVLEQLEEKQRKAWKEQADKEEARLIEELTLARWVPTGAAHDH